MSFHKWFSGSDTGFKVIDDEEREREDSLDLDDEDISNYLASHREKHAERLACTRKLGLLVALLTAIVALTGIGLLGFAMGNRNPTCKPGHLGPTHSFTSNGDAQADRHMAGGHTHHSHDTTPPQPSHKEPKQCGTSPEEARHRGCIFEPQLTAWVPRDCAFPEVVAEYQDAVGDMMADWPWFWDPDASRPVEPASIPSLQAGNYSAIYTTYQSSHALHCLYCWRKMSYALEHGIGMMDARCHQFYHQRHCAYFVSDVLVANEERRELGQADDGPLQKWSYPILYHNCVPLASTVES